MERGSTESEGEERERESGERQGAREEMGDWYREGDREREGEGKERQARRHGIQRRINTRTWQTSRICWQGNIERQGIVLGILV